MSYLEKSQADNSQAKPEPIVIGVAGFNAFATPSGDPKSVDWAGRWFHLFSLPPFEMYLAEKTGNQDRQAWKAWLEQDIITKGDDMAYLDYANWHTNKGYWVNETPMGELK